MQELQKAHMGAGGGPMDFNQLPQQMQPQRPCFGGYGAFQQMPAMPFPRPPPFMCGYGMPMQPMPYCMPPPDMGYGRMLRGDSMDRRKGKGKGRGRRRRREGRSPRRRSLRRGKVIGDPPPKFGETWEESRQQHGTRLISEIAPQGVEWEYRLSDESRRCFAGYLQCPVSQDRLDAFFWAIQHGTTWLQPTGPFGVIPRKTAWMVADGCRCTYRYGGIEVQPQVFPEWMPEIMGVYMKYCGLPDPAQWPNSCNVNLYENGSQSVGWHADDEALFQGLHQDIRILSLSLGQKRKFDLKKNWPEEGEKSMHRLLLGNGCLCTMEGMVQKHYQHRVPKEGEDLGPRINLTWRWILKHAKACPKSGRC